VTMESKHGFIGLVTNIAESQAPAGALRKAENVVIRRPGAIEPRPAFQYFSKGWFSSTITNVNKIFSYDGYDIFLGYRPSTTDYRISKVTASTDATDVDGTRLAMFREDMRLGHAVARGNLYLAAEQGVYRASAHSDVAANGLVRAGLAPEFTVISASTLATAPTWLPSGSRAAYRVMARRTDANGLIVRSRPSAAFVAEGTGGADRSVLVAVALADTPGEAVGYDELEIYRTRTFAAGVTIDEEYALVGVVPAVLSGGSSAINYEDHAADDERGEAMHTSASREGAAMANYEPPACGAIEPFRGCLFFGNTRGPRRLVASYRDAGTITTSTGIGIRAITGDTTASSNQITNASSTTGIQRGMVLATSGGPFPDRVWVTGISGTTITVSEAAAATVVGQALEFSDAMLIDGEWRALSDDAAGLNVLDTIHAVSVGEVQAVHGQTPPLGGYTNTVVIESISRSASAALTVNATHGDEYDPPLPLYGETAEAGEQDVYPNGLAWSKQDEPEHVPLPYFTRVGDAKKAILALRATRDALFVFKEDGIWRLTGSSPLGAGWRIDPFDMTTFCVLPSSVASVNNAIYLLSNKGIVRVTDRGVEIVSGPIDNEVRELVYHAQANAASDGYYSLDGVEGAAAAVNERDGEYLLLVGDVMPTLRRMLVFNTLTDAWTTWRLPGAVETAGGGITASRASTIAWSSVTAGLIAGTITGGRTDFGFMRSVAPGTTEAYSGLSMSARYEYAEGDNFTAGEAATVNAGGAAPLAVDITVQVDDLVRDSTGKLWRVSSTDGLTNTAVILTGPAGATFPSGAVTLLRPVICKVQPGAFVQPGFATKAWSQVVIGFTRFTGAAFLRHVASGSLNLEDEATQQVSSLLKVSAANGYTAYYLGGLFRHLVTRAFARSWLLRSEIQWAQPFGDAILELVTASASPASPNNPQQSSAT
jgi:hypothetical protein